MEQGTAIARVNGLIGAGQYAEAARLLIGAAAGGDVAAIAGLAQARIAGNLIRRDLAAARDLLRRAGAAGDRDSALLHASFLAAGVGGPADWAGALASIRTLAPSEPRAAAQLRLLDAMDLDAEGFPVRAPETRLLAEAPHAVAVDNFVSEAEGRYLQRQVEAALEPSTVVDPATGRMVSHPVRRSDAAMFGVFAEDLVVNAINRRMAALSGTAPAQGEPLQLLRYRPGGEYKPHMDALPSEPNQRILTILIYLSDGYRGGETQFPRTGLSFRGRRGDALLFRNATEDGQADPLSIHAGLPVTSGTKIIASRWIRARPFTYPPPKPFLDL
jgi:prolyl 4-hydroxylase